MHYRTCAYIPQQNGVAECNDLFSLFEQQILFLEKLAETTDLTTDRHGHDGPSRVSRFKTLRNSEKWVLKSTLLTS